MHKYVQTLSLNKFVTLNFSTSRQHWSDDIVYVKLGTKFWECDEKIPLCQCEDDDDDDVYDDDDGDDDADADDVEDECDDER